MIDSNDILNITTKAWISDLIGKNVADVTDEDVRKVTVGIKEWMDEFPSEEERLRKENEELKKEVATDDLLLEQRQKLLDLFDCKLHGPSCIPNAIEEVIKLRARLALLERVRDAAEYCQSVRWEDDGYDKLAEALAAARGGSRW